MKTYSSWRGVDGLRHVSIHNQLPVTPDPVDDELRRLAMFMLMNWYESPSETDKYMFADQLCDSFAEHLAQLGERWTLSEDDIAQWVATVDRPPLDYIAFGPQDSYWDVQR